MSGETNHLYRFTRHTGRMVRCVCCFSVVGLGLVWWGGCSVEKNYELLNKFFDGVPDPNALDPYDGRAIAQSSTYSEHKPYIDDACFECHTNPSEMYISKGDSSICLKCHDDITEVYPYMHGAVTGNACLMCHNPHISALEHLLRDDGPGMCLQCHELETEKPTPSHVDLTRSCIECHSGHGGDVPFFLHLQPSDEEQANEPMDGSTPVQVKEIDDL